MDWQNLKTLDIGCCNIGSLKRLANIDWKQLRTLELWGNDIEDILELRYLDLKQIQHLKLSTKVDDVDSNHICDLELLLRVDLYCVQ